MSYRPWVSALAVAATLSCTSTDGSRGGPLPTALLPSPSATSSPRVCDPPVLAAPLAAAVRHERATPGLQGSASFKTTPTIRRVRAVRELFPPSAARAGVTAVVFDAGVGKRTVTMAFPVRVSASRADVPYDLGGLVEPWPVGAEGDPIRVRYGRGFFLEFVFSYGTASVPDGSTVTETFVTRRDAESFTSEVCDGVFTLGGVGHGSNDALTHDVLEFKSAAGTPLLRLELDPGPVD